MVQHKQNKRIIRFSRNMYLVQSTTWDGFAPYPGLLPRSKPTYLFLRRQMVPTLCNMVVEQLSNQGGRGGGTIYQQLVSRRNQGVVERFKMIQKGLSLFTGYENSGVYRIPELWYLYHNSGVYRIPELWFLQDKRIRVNTGYQNSSVYKIPELWCIQDTRTLVYIGHQNSNIYLIPERVIIVYRIPELWFIQNTRTLVYTGYQNSGVYRTPEL